MRLFNTLIFTILILTSFNASAAYIRKTADGGQTKWSSHQSFIDFAMKFEQTAPINSRAPAELTRNVRYNSPALKNLLKLKSLTPTGFAFTAALTAAGYFLDNNGDVMSEGSETFDTDGLVGFCSGPGYSGANTFNQCKNKNPNTITQPFNGNQYYFFSPSVGWNTGFWSPPAGSGHPVGQEPVSSPTPVSDDEFITDVSPDIDWGKVVFTDDTVGSQPIPTPELQQVEDTINQWFTENYIDNSTSTTTNTSTTTVTNPDGTQTTTGTEETELPAFCTWAGIVCDAINWMREPFESPTDVLLPTEEVEIPSYTSGLPDSGSCPAPYDVTAFGTAIAISYQPFCDLASIIRPLVLAASGLLAAYILVGRGAKA